MTSLTDILLFSSLLLPSCLILCLFGDALNESAKCDENFIIRYISKLTLILCRLSLVCLTIMPFAFLVVFAYKC